MAEHSGAHTPFDASKLLDPKKYDIELKSPEKPEELQSRLKREGGRAQAACAGG